MTQDAPRYFPLDAAAEAQLGESRRNVVAMRAHLVASERLDPGADVVAVVIAALACVSLELGTSPARQEALGVALGDELAHRLGWTWQRVEDPWGKTLAVVSPTAAAHVYPLEWVVKRLEHEGRFDDVAEWFDEVVATARSRSTGAAAR